jgi:hypothetical protein
MTSTRFRSDTTESTNPARKRKDVPGGRAAAAPPGRGYAVTFWKSAFRFTRFISPARTRPGPIS